MNVRARNNVVVRGEGPPIVFAHGFGCDQRMWRKVAPRFEATNQVVLFDYVGAGASDRAAYDPKRYATLDGYAKDVLEICDALGLVSPVFVGHSVSAMIGVLAANAAPGLFERLVLVSPSPRFVNDPPEYHGGFEQGDIEGLLELLDGNFMGWATMLSSKVLTSPDLADELKTSFCSTDPLCLREFARATFLSDHRAALDTVTPPCLVVQCSDDEIAPTCVGEFVAKRIPRASFRLLDAPGHMPQMSHPDAVHDLLRAYLSTSREELGAS